jgi:NAD(P)-dependent dehydrogenase (short-subunit alcohol dehydrogenase family)
VTSQRNLNHEQMRAAVGQTNPLGRVGEPEDVAAAAVFLTSGESRYITGVALPVDGGFIAGY